MCSTHGCTYYIQKNIYGKKPTIMERWNQKVERFREASIKCCCGLSLSGKTVLKALAFLFRVIQLIISRCLYVLFTIFAVSRVVALYQDSTYWLLLLTLCPLGLETLHVIFFAKGKEGKWYVFFSENISVIINIMHVKNCVFCYAMYICWVL